MSGIFAHLREAALTMQQGGGIGYDFSDAAAKGTLVKGVGADASGPLSFMDVWDSMCRTNHERRVSPRRDDGDLCRARHPDIEAFIEAKREHGRLRMFNLSVLVTDAFMQAVAEDAPWQLSFAGTWQTCSPRARCGTRSCARPMPTPNRASFSSTASTAKTTSGIASGSTATIRCGEQPLPPYGACPPGSLNLARFVEHPFTGEARLDTDRLAQLVPDAVRMMDNIIDISGFPAARAARRGEQKRRIGLGVTGLADALIMCGLRYGSSDAVTATDAWLGHDPARRLPRLDRAR